ncbi:MAG: methylenetetrahydrofolate reductase C-terminal domain-containing protein [Alphaproteobacteria bacterium]|nr:methylenetetrahydrofolate reductase C-terminal domain-containing protein [Alphaproteobacteria bacterium]
MYTVRLWSVRHARTMELAYGAFESVLRALDPLFGRIGYTRLERPVAAAERAIKGLLFDCRMCGQCVLSSTGMSCPMNCPKSLRNGPCGGVRRDGFCEVAPAMRCVWVEAYDGSGRMRHGGAITEPLPPVDHRRRGRSSWLAVARGEHAPSESPLRPELLSKGRAGGPKRSALP